MGTQERLKVIKNLIAVILLLLISGLLGCSNVANESETVKEYILKVDDIEIPRVEVMIYVNQVTLEFEEIGGADVWEFQDFSDGKSAVEVAKEAVIHNIVRIKVLKSKADELGIKLSETERENVNSEALDYLEVMDEKFAVENEIDLLVLIKVFSEFAVANKVVHQVTGEFEPSEEMVQTKMSENVEYSQLKNLKTEELLTEYVLEHILFVTREKSQSGEYVTLTDDEKSIKYTKAEEIHNMAVEGNDFTQLMLDYSEETFPKDSEDNGIYRFSKALLPEEFQYGIEYLKPGEVSDIIESELGYHIFKTMKINVPSEEEIIEFENNFALYEENLQKKTVDTLKKDAFNRLFDEWKKNVDISVNKSQWETISMEN